MENNLIADTAHSDKQLFKRKTRFANLISFRNQVLPILTDLIRIHKLLVTERAINNILIK